jgi:hypothetical protein
MSSKRPKSTRIRVLFAFAKAANGDITSLGEAVLKGMTGNVAYATSPVDLTVLKTDLDNFTVAIGAALDGGKKAVAELHRQRVALIKKLRLLTHYVEAACNDDMTTFLSSGFHPAPPTVHVPPQPLPPASITKIDQGNSGQVMVTIGLVPKSYSYELRYAPLGAGGTPGTWTSEAVATIKTAAAINGLTPGTTYAFQVRALGRLGFTDWSNSFNKMST